MADSQERTEAGTQKRMKDVRAKGELSKSQDVTAWLGVGAAALMLPSTIASASSAATDQLLTVRSVIANPDPARALQALATGLGSLAGTVAPLLAVVALAVVGGSAIQGDIHPKKFKGHFEQFNLLTGVKRTFGTQALWQGAKSLLKTGVVALVLYSVIQGLMPVLLGGGSLPVSSLLAEAGGGVSSLVQFAVFAGLGLAAVDVFVVIRRNRKKTRMTKKEVKDESKNTEGDPLIKSQRRSRQLAMSRNRMIAAVAGADVVLLNPTHLAVALKYEPGKSAPRVVAKGAGTIAARIREEADAKGVPMVRDVPLARALHAACEIGQEIPVELYTAVARVLAFVIALTSRGRRTKRVETMPTSFLNSEAA
ncbi:flagellar type III secretion system protein FlhB [Paenarthrobacter sp. DKR-5]|uniref:EscU/YscU/HrcU family type III secretion system export apparatus switch protein n=1 Tax=Paenarthrobacter sp. DKR-5 TaxID=2835535 RepID=UPI001BDC8274|nr:EscU/YscU/HrcU family type III secretion system export apparatus switch protein [Paenarthrobacter sp. DKR-5]MBT1002814.1 flagellar type III secretion system protein FlhB [Paenarthrobacter sp. DKR-5]